MNCDTVDYSDINMGKKMKAIHFDTKIDNGD